MSTLTKALAVYDKAVALEAENRQRAKEAIAFALDLDQWPASVAAERKAAARPTLTSPLPARYIRDIINQARMMRPAVRVKPVDNSGDLSTSLALEGIIRNIEYVSNADTVYDAALEQAVTGGFGYIRVSSDYAARDSFDLELLIERIPDQFMVYGDPASVAYDSADWDDCIVLSNRTEASLKAEYPGRKSFEPFPADVTVPEGTITVAEWFHREELPAELMKLSNGAVVWADDFEPVYYAAMGVSVVETRQSSKLKVRRYVLDGSGELSADVWPGSYIPIIPVYGVDYISGGKRVLKGVVSDAQDAQIMDNYWASAATELVANAPKAPWLAEEGSLVAPEQWARSGRANIPYLTYRKGANPPQRLGSDPAPAATLMAQTNANNLVRSAMGMDAGGKVADITSGGRPATDSLGNYHFADNLARAIRHVGRVLIDAIPHIYTGSRVVRILGEGDKTGAVAVQDLALDAGKYDTHVKVGDNYATRREETRYALTELVRTYPAAAPYVAPMLLDNLDLPGAETLKAQLMSAAPNQQQPAQPTLDQQILLKQAQNAELKLQVEMARLNLDGEKLRLEQAMAIKKAEREDLRIQMGYNVDRESLNIKRQAQDLAEVEAGVDIAAKYIDTVG